MRPSRLITSVQDVRDAKHRPPGRQTPAPDRQVEDPIPTRASRRPPFGVFLLAVLVAAVCSATAYWVGGRGPNVYAADTQVVIDLPDSVDSSQAERILATEAATIKGAGVLEPVAESLGAPLDDIEKSTDASVIPGSQIIRIRASSEDPDRAEAIASAVVDTYVGTPRSDSGSAARAFIEGELAKVSSQQADVQTRLDQLRLQPTPPDPATERTLVEQNSTLDARVGALQTELVRLQLQELERGKPRLISSPRVLADPVAPTPMRTAALGLIAGLALAAALVVIGLRGRADPPRP